MKEATLRDFFLGTVSVDQLAVEVRGAVEHQSTTTRRVHIQDLATDEQFVITAQMLVRLCDAVLAGDLPGPALEPIAFAVIASEHLHWADDDELASRVLYDWASPEISWELTPDNVRMFRGWLTGEEQPSPEPDITPDTLSGERFVGRTVKAWIRPPEDAEPGEKV